MLSLMCEFNHCVNVGLLCEYSVFGSTNVYVHSLGSEHMLVQLSLCISHSSHQVIQCAQMPFNVLFLIREDLGLAIETTHNYA